MGGLERILKQIREHLSGLSVSQRVALGLCAVIVVGSTAWLLQWSGSKEAIPLLEQDFSREELTAAQSQLEDMGVKYKIVGNRINVYVDPQERRQILANLVRGGGLPKDTTAGFKEILGENNVLASNSEREKRWTLALANELAMTFTEIEGVERAQVYIDKLEKRRIHGPSVFPTASVSLWMEGGAAVDRKLAYAVASAVSGAVGGLDPWNVKVMDMVAGRTIPIPDPAHGVSLDMLEKRQESDRHFEEKIRNQLGYVAGVRVAVFSELETDSRYQEEVQGEPYKKEEASKDITQTRVAPGQEPGVVPNVPRSVSPTASADQMRHEEMKSKTEGVPAHSTTITKSMQGALKGVTASVGIPRRYLVSVYKEKKPDHPGEPKDEDLEPIKTEIFDDVRKQVANIIKAADPETQVAVSMFYEVGDPGAGGEGQSVAESGGVTGLAREYGAEAGLAALAVVSLAMMLMMVRRASVGPDIPSDLAGLMDGEQKNRLEREDQAGTPLGHLAEGGPIGEAIQAPGMLVAEELDDQTLETRQLIEQVSGVIRDEPQIAADLVSKWIERDS